jgi:hypothetical protein
MAVITEKSADAVITRIAQLSPLREQDVEEYDQQSVPLSDGDNVLHPLRLTECGVRPTCASMANRPRKTPAEI